MPTYLAVRHTEEDNARRVDYEWTVSADGVKSHDLAAALQRRGFGGTKVDPSDQYLVRIELGLMGSEDAAQLQGEILALVKELEADAMSRALR